MALSAKSHLKAKGRALLLQWLTPAQRRQFEEQGYFDVVGCATQRRYRVQYGSVANVQEIDFEGQSAGVLCFAPKGGLSGPRRRHACSEDCLRDRRTCDTGPGESSGTGS